MSRCDPDRGFGGMTEYAGLRNPVREEEDFVASMI